MSRNRVRVYRCPEHPVAKCPVWFVVDYRTGRPRKFFSWRAAMTHADRMAHAGRRETAVYAFGSVVRPAVNAWPE